MSAITYFSEDIVFRLPHKRQITAWVKKCIQAESYSLTVLNFIFCTDDYLLQINKQYLCHDYYTDIITFNQSEEENTVEGDIFISIDRVRDNASALQTEFGRELQRVLIHGVLHLCGYNDHSDADKHLMREKENFYLQLLK